MAVIDVLEGLVRQTLLLIQRDTEYNVEVNASVKFPCFYSCYDWHSAVHSHWQIVASLDVICNSSFSDDVQHVLSDQISKENIQQELKTIQTKGKQFEMPYGMAWVLLLSAYLYKKEGKVFKECYEAMEPLESWAISLFSSFCDKNEAPVRSALHQQTAFSLSIAIDASRILGKVQLTNKIETYVKNQFLTLNSPSLETGQIDFLSPSLSEAVLVGKVITEEEFPRWLETYLGSSTENYFASLLPVKIEDPVASCHLVGLNFSRCWMLNQVAQYIPDHPWADSLKSSAVHHFEEGMSHALNTDLMITHWIPTFTLYAFSSFPRPDALNPNESK